MKKKHDFNCYSRGNSTICRSTRPRIQRDIEGNPINQNPSPNPQDFSMEVVDTFTSKYSKDMLENIASEKNLELLTHYQFYENINKKNLKWKCESCGNEFLESFKNIKRQKYSCPKCRDKIIEERHKSRRKKKYRELRQIIESKGGKLISEKYYNAHSPVIIECDHGHRWESSPTNIKSGTWCPECKKLTLSRKFRKYCINDLKNFAVSKGGKCLNKNYLGWDKPHRWECAKNHIWEASPRNVMAHGTWCPECAEKGIFERVIRGIFEKLFDKPFKKSYPIWLNMSKIDEPGGRFHLDGYNKDLGIAFECQGIQHYKFEPFFHKDLKDFYEQQERDRLKRKLCERHNVILIEIGWIKEGNKLRRLKYNELENYIRRILESKGIKIPFAEPVDWTKFLSIHKDQDLILKLLFMKGSLTTGSIASKLKIGLKSTSRHLKALKSLNLVKVAIGKQNRKIWSLNTNSLDLIKRRISKISDSEIKERENQLRETARKILRLLEDEGKLSTSEITEKIGYSKRTVEKYIKSLESSDLVKFERRAGHGKSHPKLWSIK